jgi:hypothetical protein
MYFDFFLFIVQWGLSSAVLAFLICCYMIFASLQFATFSSVWSPLLNRDWGSICRGDVLRVSHVSRPSRVVTITASSSFERIPDHREQLERRHASGKKRNFEPPCRLKR